MFMCTKHWICFDSISMYLFFVGYPNVGKSSLINSLKKNDICDVSFIPGHTQ